MWEHGGCSESVQQDVISKCGHVECYNQGIWYVKEALQHFEQMCKEGVQPDDIDFVCLLSACAIDSIKCEHT